MADDIADSIPEQQLRFNNNPIDVSVCLVDPTRTIVSWGTGHVDKPEALSKLLLREVQEKCMPLQIFLAPPEKSDAVSGKIGYAQGGFIRYESILTGPEGSDTNYSVFAITAKHNLRRVADVFKRVYIPYMAHFKIPHGGEARVYSKDLGWLPTEDDIFDLRAGLLKARRDVLEYGIDVSLGQLITDFSESVTGKKKSFARVGPGFKPMNGQKVGMAVLFPYEARPTKKSVTGALEDEVDISEDKLKDVYGVHDQVNVYTGEIMYVGKDLIEYDINSFTGCSGAVVFLLDEGQSPASVDPSEYGKAIAIHSGAHPVIGDRNVGFLISSHPALIDTNP